MGYKPSPNIICQTWEKGGSNRKTEAGTGLKRPKPKQTRPFKKTGQTCWPTDMLQTVRSGDLTQSTDRADGRRGYTTIRWGDPYGIPWLTQQSTTRGMLLGDHLASMHYSHQYTKPIFEREKAHLTLSCLSPQPILSLTLCNFRPNPQPKTYRRRRWLPANDGGTTFFSSEPTPKQSNLKHQPPLILAGESKSDLNFL